MIYQVWAVILKELQLLRRDRGGLAVLFVMPVALVLIVCLVQDNILKTSGAGHVDVLLLDGDQGEFSQRLHQQLLAQGSFRINHITAGGDYQQARRQVDDGDYQIGIYLTPGFSEQLHEQVYRRVRHALSGQDPSELDQTLQAGKPALQVEYFFDPAVQGGLQAGIAGLLQQLTAAETLKIQMEAFRALLPAYVERHVSQQLGSMFAQALAQNPLEINLPDEGEPLVEVSRATSSGADFVMPTSVQHNVPAWSMFGIFFIILPLSAVLLQERAQGVFLRLQLVPGHAVGLVVGRVLAYLLLCMVQFGLMLLVGYYLLPQLGTDTLNFHGQIPALFIIALCAGLTACGFGMLLGVFARSEQQASLTAAVTIVIAAALGGIMVPVYLMPSLMQKISILSPLGWGLDAFQIVLLRGGSLTDTLPQLSQLLGCSALCFVLAWRGLKRRRC
ncbi:MAG: ABC transporter permease [Desulfuromonas sp.]|nr:ABC transporter permease [Desulfuromonas sp.]